MSDSLPLLVAWLAGALLGAAFYVCLWWTVRRGLASSRPALWFFASLVLRSALALVGFYVIGNGQWQRLALALLGFVMARSLIVRASSLSGAAGK